MKRQSRDVGVFIEGRGVKPVVVLFVDQIMMRRECRDAEHAEYVYAELADVFDLWEEETPKWIDDQRWSPSPTSATKP